MSKTEEWTNRLSPNHKYHLTYSNMNNDEALDIIDSVVACVLEDLRDEEEYSAVETMIERAREKFGTIIEARK